MKKSTLLLVTLLVTVTIQANDGKEVFKANCAACHLMKTPKGMMQPSNTPEFKKAVNALKAPPMVKVARMIRMKYAAKKDFTTFITEYITNPNVNKSICMKKALEGFGMMPAIGKTMSSADKTTVAEWIYENTNDASTMKKVDSIKCGEGKCGEDKKAMKKSF